MFSNAALSYGKTRHLDNQDTYDMFKGIHNTQAPLYIAKRKD